MHPITKLQGKENAQKYFHKCLRFIKLMPEVDLNTQVTYISWGHSDQLKSDDLGVYNDVLVHIANTLKYSRLPSEQLYYLGNGNFMIISESVPQAVFQEITQMMNHQLLLISYSVSGVKYKTQYKVVTQLINRNTCDKMNSFSNLMRRLKRELEVKVLSEYQ